MVDEKKILETAMEVDALIKTRLGDDGCLKYTTNVLQAVCAAQGDLGNQRLVVLRIQDFLK